MVAFATVVQADFSGTAFGAAATWTDITRFVRMTDTLTINQWRQDELSDITPSTMSLTLDNADVPGDPTAPNAGRFTPFLSTSPWSPRILPGVRIRVGVTISGTTYWLFDGYVDPWDASYIGGEFEVCKVGASDLFARFGGMDPLRSTYIEEVFSDNPFAVYPLTEPNGATVAADISGGGIAGNLSVFTNQRGDVAFGSATGIPTDGAATLTLNATLTSAAADDTIGDYLSTGLFPQTAANTWTAEAVISVGATLATTLSHSLNGRCLIFGWVGAAATTPQGLWLKYNAGAVQLMSLQTGNGVGPDLNDGQIHHLAITETTGGEIYYVDGVQVSTTAFFLGGVVGSGSFKLGAGDPAAITRGWGVPFAAFRGGIGYAAFYNSALSGARIAAHNAAARTGFAGESTGAHITRLLTYRTNLGSTLDPGQGTVSLHPFAGASFQQALLDTAKAEGGVVYIDPATGRLVFLDRRKLRDPAVALTLDITAQQTTGDLDFRADSQLLLNDVTISRPGGAAQRSASSTSKASYGAHGLSESRIIGTDIDAANAAGWLVANGKDVRQRTPSLPVDLLTEPSTAVATGVLTLTPLQRVALINPPASAPASDVIVQGRTITLGLNVFTVELFTSPLPRPTLRFDAAADAFTKLDSGNVWAW